MEQGRIFICSARLCMDIGSDEGLYPEMGLSSFDSSQCEYHPTSEF